MAALGNVTDVRFEPKSHLAVQTGSDRFGLGFALGTPMALNPPNLSLSQARDLY